MCHRNPRTGIRGIIGIGRTEAGHGFGFGATSGLGLAPRLFGAGAAPVWRPRHRAGGASIGIEEALGEAISGRRGQKGIMTGVNVRAA